MSPKELTQSIKRRNMRLDPATLVPNAKSVVVCAMNYYTPYASAGAADEGRISRYAWGTTITTCCARG